MSGAAHAGRATDKTTKDERRRSPALLPGLRAGGRRLANENERCPFSSWGVTKVSKCSNILGASVLAAAIVGVLSATPGNAAKPTTAPYIKPFAATHVQTTFDRFIVRYRDGAAAPRTPAAVVTAFQDNARRAGVAG